LIRNVIMDLDGPMKRFQLRGKSYKRYVLCVLTLVYTLNFLDRGLIVLLLQAIKGDLGLSDTQLGFLTGIAFGAFYATLGLPIARWADRGNRVTITSLAIGLWGGTVMLSVFVTNFAQVVIARIASAVGESGCMPPTYSLIGDYFPAPSERAFAMSIYWLASPLATLISFIVGGWLNELYGWRFTFFIMGVPALLVAVLVRLTIAEPRVQVNRGVADRIRAPALREVLEFVWRLRSARHLIAAIVLLYTMGAGLGPWYAAFMMRSHGMLTAELGVWLGLIFGISGIVGILLGGYVSGRWLGNNERAQMRLSAISSAAIVPCLVLFLTLSGKEPALFALIPVSLVFSVFAGPSFALLQRLVTDDTRATTLAIVMLFANLIGMGVGPQLVGILSDMLRPPLGSESLRYSMLAMSSVALWAAYHFARAARTIKDDLSAITSGSCHNTVDEAVAEA
jgi:MFS family permease